MCIRDFILFWIEVRKLGNEPWWSCLIENIFLGGTQHSNLEPSLLSFWKGVLNEILIWFLLVVFGPISVEHLGLIRLVQWESALTLLILSNFNRIWFFGNAYGSVLVMGYDRVVLNLNSCFGRGCKVGLRWLLFITVTTRLLIHIKFYLKIMRPDRW